MNRRLPLLLGALTFASLLGAGSAAEAGRGGGGGHSGGGGGHFGGGAHFSGGVHYGGGGGVHAYAGGGVHYSARVGGYGGYGYGRGWGVRGHVYVGGYGYGYPYYPRPYYYYPVVPSYYGEGYAPIQPTYAAPGIAAAAMVVQPELPRFGIGLFAGGVSTDYNTATNTQETDVGVLGRYRLTPGLIIEGELGRTSTSVNNVDNLRVDRRLGGSLIYEIGAQNRWAPYVLAGLGVQQAQVNGDYSTTQDYGEIGAGLRFAVSPHFHITADIRAGSRSSVSNDTTAMAPAMGTAARSVTPPTSDSGQSEDYTLGRVSAILYF